MIPRELPTASINGLPLAQAHDQNTANLLSIHSLFAIAAVHLPLASPLIVDALLKRTDQ